MKAHRSQPDRISSGDEVLKAAGVQSVAIVIPAHDEEASLPVVLEASARVLRSLTDVFQVIVVDDSSRDGTRQVVNQFTAADSRFVGLTNEQNIGAAPSMLRGLRASTADASFFIPADGQVMPDQLLACLDALAVADVVCTRRVRRADGLHRKVAAAAYNWVIRRMFGLPVHDVDSALLIRRNVVERVGDELSEATGFISVEIVVRAINMGFRVAEVPIEHHVRYAGRQEGLAPRHTARILLSAVRFRMSSEYRSLRSSSRQG